MHTVLGVGKQRIVFLNVEKSSDVSALFESITKTYRMMYDMAYPNIHVMHRNKCLLLSDDINMIKSNDLCVCFDEQPLGIYVGNHAYQRKIAQRIVQIAGIELFAKENAQHIHIGIGGLCSKAEVYMVLKDAILGLPAYI